MDVECASRFCLGCESATEPARRVRRDETLQREGLGGEEGGEDSVLISQKDRQNGGESPARTSAVQCRDLHATKDLSRVERDCTLGFSAVAQHEHNTVLQRSQIRDSDGDRLESRATKLAMGGADCVGHSGAQVAECCTFHSD